MISFIIIGKNEANTLKMCIDSVLTSVKYNQIKYFEIVYVDSQSTDNSLDIAKQFSNIQIFQIIGTCNAAIARNIGAKESKGKILCFLDADMELDKDFLKKIIKNNQLIYPFISGQIQNIFYNNYQIWKKVDEKKINFESLKDKYFVTTGGYFIINRDLWFAVKGMKTKYRRSQDLDLGLRLSKKDFKLLRKKDLMVKHHTVDYQNKKRMWKMLFDKSLIYQTSLLYREHIFNKHIYPVIFRKSYTLIILIISIILSLINVYCIGIFFFLVLIRVVLQKNVKNNASIFDRLIYRILIDIFSLIGFFIFFPPKYELNYKKII